MKRKPKVQKNLSEQELNEDFWKSFNEAQKHLSKAINLQSEQIKRLASKMNEEQEQELLPGPCVNCKHFGSCPLVDKKFSVRKFGCIWNCDPVLIPKAEVQEVFYSEDFYKVIQIPEQHEQWINRLYDFLWDNRQ